MTPREAATQRLLVALGQRIELMEPRLEAAELRGASAAILLREAHAEIQRVQRDRTLCLIVIVIASVAFNAIAWYCALRWIP